MWQVYTQGLDQLLTLLVLLVAIEHVEPIALTTLVARARHFYVGEQAY